MYLTDSDPRQILNREDRGRSHRALSRGAPPVLSVAPTDYPVSIDEVKLACRIPTTREDPLLQDYIATATELVQLDAEVALVSQTRIQYLDDFPDGPIELRLPPVTSVTSITYYDTTGTQQTLSSSLYKVGLNSRPGIIEPAWGQVWPTARYQTESVAVTFVCGASSGAVRTIAKQAIYLRVGAMYRNREMSTEETQSYDNLITKICWRGAA